MTVFEHAMLGVTGTLGAGLHRRYGWTIVAAAGAVAVLPDWDGLSLLFGAAAFDRVHRVWGHNLLVAGLSGALLMACVHCFVWAGRATRSLALPSRAEELAKNSTPERQARETAKSSARESQATERARSGQRGAFRMSEMALWAALGLFVSLSHLAADLVYSGHATLTDWGISLLWPFSKQSFAYPLVHWGDVGTTLIFAASMFAMVRWPTRLQRVSLITLALIVAYIALRGLSM